MNKRLVKRSTTASLTFAIVGGVFLSGCVNSSVNTPSGFTKTLATPTAADVLSLNETGGLPTPETRPDAKTEVAANDPGVAGDTPKIVENSPTPPSPVTVAASSTPIKTDNVANQRILAAQNAPLADGTEQSSPTATAPAAIVAKAEPKKSGLLNALFGNSKRRPPAPVRAERKQAPAPKSIAQSSQRVVATASASGSTAALPGVNKDRALGVSSGGAAQSTAPIQVASAGGLARLAPNGIRTQTAGVDVKCLKPALVRVLKTVERKFGKPVVVTSGYRSPSRNKRARGAKNSLHIYCAAADIQVAGVSKWKLAKYLRSMPGRGGVGTYCHTKSVHVDIGPNRDWNWRCRRKK